MVPLLKLSSVGDQIKKQIYSLFCVCIIIVMMNTKFLHKEKNIDLQFEKRILTFLFCTLLIFSTKNFFLKLLKAKFALFIMLFKLVFSLL